jgi:regulator of RNase E activity RraB
VKLFRRRERELDLEDRSPQLGLRVKDLLVLDGLIKAGADLRESRHALWHLYASAEPAARAIAAEAAEAGYEVTVREPLEGVSPTWSVVCETRVVTTPEVVRAADERFHAIAERHGGTYDGWEAGV